MFSMGKKEYIVLILFLLFLFPPLLGSLYKNSSFSDFDITSFFTKGRENYYDYLGNTYDSDSVYLWIPNNKISMKGLGLTGNVTGTGTFLAYLIHNDNSYLISSFILDNETIEFGNDCVDTCSLPSFESDKYLIKFITEGVEANLNSLVYSVNPLSETPLATEEASPLTISSDTSGISSSKVTIPSNEEESSFSIQGNNDTNGFANFRDPTPTNNTNLTYGINNTAIINVSIEESDLNNVTWNWGDSNVTCSIYSQTIGNYSCTNYADDNLILAINFDTSTDFADLSGEGNDGINHGSTWISSGRFGGMRSFDGSNDYVDLIPVQNLPITLLFYVKDIKSSNEAIFGSKDYHGFGISINSTRLSLSGDYGTASPPSDNFLSWENEISEAFVWIILNDTSSLIGINNGSISQQVNSRVVTTYNGVYSLGAYLQNNGYNIYGSLDIDEVHIYNRSLSLDEIKAYYESNLHKFNSTKWNLEVNESNLSVGNYTYSVCASDTSGNKNCTEQRIFNVQNSGLPSLTLNLINYSLNVSQNRFFNVTVNITCMNSDCGDINVSLDPALYTDRVVYDPNSYTPYFSFTGGTFSGSTSNYIGFTTGTLTGNCYQITDADYVDSMCWGNEPCMIASDVVPTYLDTFDVFANEADCLASFVPPGKGIISNVRGTTPFYTNETNPRTINLNAGQSEEVVFYVNATGNLDSVHEFYVYANLTSDMTINNESSHWNVTIVEPTDLIYPNVTFVLPTPVNNSNITETSTVINVSVLENVTSCELNGLGTINGAFTSNSYVDIDGYRIHTFKSDENIIINSNINAEVLVVAGGGGGGGHNVGGGGGAGGLVYNTSYRLNSGESINVIVGSGGAGGPGYKTSGTNGANSRFGTIVAVGGGGGGSDNAISGKNGGSGGGSGFSGSSAGTGIPGQGYNGGSGAGTAGNGGGGAGETGNTDGSGAGGDGLNYLINGSNIYYAGGGSGGSDGGANVPGLGGGGHGGSNGLPGGNAVANTGGGGGGAGGGYGGAGGSGGSGIVIVRYKLVKYLEIHNSSEKTWANINLNNLSVGTYYYNISCSDGKLSGTTETRVLNVQGGNILTPITFVNPTPTNNTNLTYGINNTAIINVSIEESDLKNVTWNWNGTNYSMYDDSLVLMLNFDSDATDDSLYSHDGTVYGATLTTGKYGQGYSFDGSDSINYGDFFNYQNFTIGMWLKAGTSQPQWSDIIDNHHDGDSNWVIQQVSSETNHYDFRGADFYLTANVWQYLTIVKKGTTCKAYVDASLIDSVSCSDILYDSDPYRTLTLGDHPDYPRNWIGVMDEVFMYKRGFSDNEVKQLYYSNLQKFNSTKWNLEVNESNLSVGNYTYSVCASDSSGNKNCTEQRIVNIVKSDNLPNASNFNESNETTNFLNVPNINNVTSLTLGNNYGKIKLPSNYGVNTENENYNQFVKIGKNFISVNTSQLNPSFNNSANITLNNVVCNPLKVYYGNGVYTSHIEIVAENNICNATTDPSCTNIQCSNNVMTFTVSHFTGYAANAISNLTIWDETDTGMPYGDQIKYTNNQVKFFANYTNSSNLSILNANCMILFNDTLNTYNMTYNSLGFYEYNRSYSISGNYTYNIICNKTGYGVLNISDLVNVSEPSNYNFTYLVNETTIVPSGYKNGTLNGVYYDTTTNSIKVLGSQGTYKSEIFNAEDYVTWVNISWNSQVGGALLDNQSIESSMINMTDNVILYHMDESSGNIIDYSGNGNDASNNAAAYQATGIYDSGLNFDGNDCLARDNVIDANQNTLEVWFKPNINYNTSSGWTNFIGQWHRYDLSYSSGASGNLCLRTNDRGSVCTLMNLTAGKWYHFAGTWDTSVPEGRLYVNGQLVKNNTVSSSAINFYGSSMRVGCTYDNSGTWRWANGVMDELAIYNRVLSANEIQAHYEREGSGNLSLSVKSCDDPVCAGENWNATYTKSPQNLNVSNNQYFQYEANLTKGTIDPALYNVTIAIEKSINLPNVTNFIGSNETTNFTDVQDINNVTSLTLGNNYGEIRFPGNNSIDAEGEDYDSFVEIGLDFVSVNSSQLDPTFNASANITLNNVVCNPLKVYYGNGVYTSHIEIVAENNICNSTTDPSCTNIQCSNNVMTFTVSHFTGYAANALSNLTIWDETDTGMPYGDQIKYTNNQVKFFANYTNLTGGPILGANCLIEFSDKMANMTHNSSGLYEYNRNYSTAGNYTYNITCNKIGYGTLNATDNVTILSSACDYYINDCKSSNWESNKKYCLNENINNYDGTCMTITNNSVTLNGNGHYIDGDGDDNGYGVYVKGFDDITLINIDTNQFDKGVYIKNSTNSSLLNLTNTESMYGLVIRTSSNITVSNTTLENNTNFDLIVYAESDTQCKNRITNIIGSENKPIKYYNQAVNLNNWNNNVSELILCDADGSVINNLKIKHNVIKNNAFYMIRTDNSQISNIEINNTQGVSLISGSLNELKNITSLNNKYGMYIHSSYLNKLSSSNMNNNDLYGLALELSLQNILENITSNNNSIGFYILNQSQNNIFKNIYSMTNTNFEIYDATGPAYRNNLIFNNTYGTIKWIRNDFLESLTLKGTLKLGSTIKLENNLAEIDVNSFILGNINSSANVTLKGLITNYMEPYILKDGMICSECHNFTSLNAGNVTFNVSSWSNYSIENVDLTAPIITLITENNSNQTEGIITLEYNVTDYSNISNCNLYINNTLNQTNLTITRNITQTFTNNFTGGIYSWNINCSDIYNNSNISETRTLNIASALLCGNNIINLGEDCDNNNLNKQTCENLGYDKGELTCSSNCNFDTSDCSYSKKCKDTCEDKGYECGNQTICSEEVNCGSCSIGDICNAGICELDCSNECKLNDKNCDSGNLMKCINTDKCNQWVLYNTCNDNNPCTINSCENDKCVFTKKDCNDEDLCTIDTCSDGTCNNKPIICENGECDEGKCIFEVEQFAPKEEEKGKIVCMKAQEYVETNSYPSEDIKIPKGKTFVVDPMLLGCNDGSLELNLEIPREYSDYEVHICRDGTCTVVDYYNETTYKCNDIISSYSRKSGVFKPDLSKIENITATKKLAYLQKEINLDNNKVIFSGEYYKVKGQLKYLTTSVNEPKNKFVKIIGSPVVLETRDLIPLDINLTLYYNNISHIDQSSISMFALVDGKWKYFGGKINQSTKSITAEIKDIQKLNENDIVFAIMANICENCSETKLEKVYSSENADTAVVFVHGFNGKVEAYSNLFNELGLTKQNLDIYAYDYQQNITLDKLSEEFSNYLELNSIPYQKLIMIGHSLGGIIIQKALNEAHEENKPYVNKVKSVVLIGVPNKGLPYLDKLTNLINTFINSDSLKTLFNLESPLVMDVKKKFNVIKKLPGINYYVIVGTKPYKIDLALIKLDSSKFFNLEGPNDGLVTSENARFVGGEEEENLCHDYWEFNLTHSELDDADSTTQLMKQIIAKDAELKDDAFVYAKKVRVEINNCQKGDVLYITGVKSNKSFIPDCFGERYAPKSLLDKFGDNLRNLLRYSFISLLLIICALFVTHSMKKHYYEYKYPLFFGKKVKMDKSKRTKVKEIKKIDSPSKKSFNRKLDKMDSEFARLHNELNKR